MKILRIKDVKPPGILIKDIPKNSFYIDWIKEHRGTFLICAFIATFLTMLSYPGILYSDSYTRISLASDLKRSLQAFFSGNIETESFRSWLTIVPSFFILLSEEIVGSIALYTFMQCFLFFLIILVLSENLTMRGHKIWNKICVICSPVIWAYGVYYEASVGCAVAMICILMMIWNWDQLNQTVFDKCCSAALLIFVCFVCFGYRANAFTIIPVLFGLAIYKGRNALRKLVVIFLISIGFLGTIFVPKILNIDTMSSFAAGFVWEIVSTIQALNEESQSEYTDYLDNIFGEGETELALQKSSYADVLSSINPILYTGSGNINSGSISENSKEILKKYVELIYHEPVTYLKTKWSFISHTLGISFPINMLEYDYDRWDQMESFGFNDSLPRERYVFFFLAYMEFMAIFRMPWLMFAAALVLTVIWRMFIAGKSSPVNLYEVTYVIALFYYGAYVLNTQSFEFRYFFPSWLLLYLIIVSLIADIFGKKGRGKEKNDNR